MNHIKVKSNLSIVIVFILIISLAMTGCSYFSRKPITTNPPSNKPMTIPPTSNYNTTNNNTTPRNININSINNEVVKPNTNKNTKTANRIGDNDLTAAMKMDKNVSNADVYIINGKIYASITVNKSAGIDTAKKLAQKYLLEIRKKYSTGTVYISVLKSGKVIYNMTSK